MENQIVPTEADSKSEVGVADTVPQGQSAEPQTTLQDAVAEVTAGNSEVLNLVQLALDGKAESLSPEQAQQVQSILEAAKQLLATSPQASQLLESVQSSLRPVIQAQMTGAQDNSGPAVSEVSGSAGMVSGSSDPETIAPSGSESVGQASFAPSMAGRTVAPSLGQSVEPANARVMAPFVQQPVRADGQLGGTLENSGQVGNLAELSGQLAAGSVGGGSVSQLLDTIVAQEAPTVTEAPAEPPPPPIGKVSIRTDKSSEFKLETGALESVEYKFILTRTDATSQASVNYQLKGIDASNLVEPSKFNSAVAFGPGQTTAELKISVKGDNTLEANQTFEVILGSTTGLMELGGGPASAKAVIGNDDSVFQVTALKSSQLEGALSESPDLIYRIHRNDTTVATTVNWTLEGLKASDFASNQIPSGVVTFAAGQSEALVTLKPLGDNIVEISPTATLRLVSAGNNATVDPNQNTASTVITNDDSVFGVAAAVASQLEGAVGESPLLTYTITRDLAIVASTVRWQLSGLQAAELAEGSPTTGEVVFAAGQTQATVQFTLRGDNVVEAASTARLTLTEAISNATISPTASFAETVINNDDSVFSVAAAVASQLEGALGESPLLTYTITRDSAIVPSTVRWQLTGLQAAELAEGSPTTGEIVFAAGQTQATVQFTLRGDNVVEAPSTARLTLTEAISNATVSPEASFAETVIANDDSVISVSSRRTEQPEGQPSQTRFIEFTISRSDATVATSVNWELSGLNPADFGGTLPSGTVQFLAGQLSALIQIPSKVDYDIEASETATVRLTSHGSNATLHTQNFTASTLVTTDDLGYFLTAVTPNVTEGASGTFSTLTFKVQRTHPLDVASSVRWEVTGYGTSSGADHFRDGTQPHGLVEFASGESEKLITFDVSGNDRVNPSRNFQVVLKDPSTGTRILSGQALGSVTDDDSFYNVAATTAQINEGHTGTVNAEFKVTRTGNLDSAQTVNYQLSALGELSVVSSDLELTGGVMTGSVTFAAQQTEATILVPVKGNSLIQADKTLLLSLVDSDGNNLSVGTGSAQVKIINDDSGLSIRTLESSLLEGTSAGSGKTHKFVIDRGNFTGSTVTVNWQVKTATGNSVDAADFGGTLPSGSVTFAAGETQKTIEINPTVDSSLESDEGFIVEISSASQGTQILQATANGLIFDDEATIQFQNATQAITEGDPGRLGQFSTVTATVLRSGYALQEGTFQWKLVATGNSPVTTADFSGLQDALGTNAGLPSGTVTFQNGSFSADISIRVVTDSIEELAEHFQLELISPSTSHLIGQQNISSFTLNDDDASFALSGSSEVLEGHLGVNKTHTFTVTRSGDITSVDTVRYRLVTVDGGALISDFTGLTSGKLEFGLNEAQKTFTLTTVGDDVIEANKAFSVELYDASTGSSLKSNASALQVSLKNDDIKVQVSGVTVDALEGNESNGNLRFKLTREGDLSGTHTVNWTIAGSGATPANAQDFVTTTGSVTFVANSAEALFDVAIKADGSYTQDSNGAAEGYTLTLTAPTSGNGISLGANTTVSGTILNDDQIVNITAPASVQEAANGQTNDHVFTITRAGKTDEARTLQWIVDPASTATAADFVGNALPSGSVTFAAGETSKTVTIQTVGDTLPEGNETILVKITTTDGNDFTNQSASTTLFDDDISVSIAAQSASVNEGVQGVTTSFPFVVSRTGDLSAAVLLKWTATGDIAGLTNTTGTVTLLANQAQVVLDLQAPGNNTVAADRNITVTLDANDITVTPAQGRTAGSTTVATAAANLTIKDDDAKIAVDTTTPASIVEGTPDQANPAEFQTVSVTINRTGEASTSHTVTWKIVPTGTDPVTATDFVIPQGGSTVNGFPSGTLTFSDAQSKTIEFQVKRDADVELAESFQIVLESSSSNLELGSAHNMTITADDPGFGVVALNESQSEGNSGNTAYTFKIVRIGSTVGVNTVNYAVTGTGNNAANAADFGGTLPSGSVTFQNGESEKTITINVSGDTTVEESEAFKVTLSNIPGGGSPSATATIVTEDTHLVASTVTSSVGEGNSGSQVLTFEVTRSGLITGSTTVNWEIGASAGLTSADFSAGQNGRSIGSGMPSGILTFAANETTKQVTVNVQGESVFEANETVPFTLSNPSGGATITTAVANATITNDDAEIYFDNTAVSVTEGDSGTANITFTVRRAGITNQVTTLNYFHSNVTTNSGDFTFDTTNPSIGSLTFASGETSKTVTFKVVGDNGINSVEGEETFRLTLGALSSGSGLRDGHTFATGTIIDNDQSLVITTGTLSQPEKRAGEGNTDFTFTVSRSGLTTSSSAVTWASSGGNPSPASANDIVGGFKTNQALNWVANNTSGQNITISAIGDDNREETETILITLNGLEEYDNVRFNGSTHAVSSNSYSFGFSIQRDESNFKHEGFSLTQGSSSFAFNSNSAIIESAFPKEGAAGATSSVWFQIQREISSAGNAYADWKVTTVPSSGSQDFSGNRLLFQVENILRTVDSTDFATTDGLGTNAGLPSGRVNFSDGETYKWVELKIQGDVSAENLEAYAVVLSGADGTSTTGSTFTAGGITGYIQPDDPMFALTPVVFTEQSGGGNQPIQIEVKRLYNTVGAASIDWAVSFLSDGTVGQDSLSNSATWYKAEATDFANGQIFNGTLNFADGESSKNIELNLQKDDLGETWYEHFLTTISNPVAGTGSQSVGIRHGFDKVAYIILDDDHTDATNVPTFSVTADKTEGVEGTLTNPTTVTYTITRSGNTALASQVAFQLVSAGAFNLSGDGANLNANSGVLNFTAGQTSKTVQATFVGNKVVANDYDTRFLLLNPATDQRGSYATTGIYAGIKGESGFADIGPGRISTTQGSANVKILNDDVRLYISGYQGVRLERNEESPLTFTLSREGKTDYDLTINYAITNSTTSNADFTQTTGTITLAANQSSVNVSLPILVNDTNLESTTTENFTLVLSSTDEHVRFGSSGTDTNLPQNASFLFGIVDNDQIYSVTTSTASVTETDSGTTQAITVKLIRQSNSAGYQGAVSVSYELVGNGANPTNATDFTQTTGTLSLAANEKEKEFTLNVVRGDGTMENNETFAFTLTGVTSGKGTVDSNAANSSKTITITNNDTGISIADAAITETEVNQNLTFTITRTGVLTNASSMNWSLVNVSSSSADFDGTTSGTIEFSAGQSSKTITVAVKGDEIAESAETFEIRLSNFVNVGDQIKVVATGTITDNDSSFSIQNSVVEVQENGGNASFTVTRTHATPQNQTISWVVSGTGTTAADATDFGGNFPSGSVTFSGNELSKTITVPITNDNTTENDETFKVTISTGAGASGDTITVAEGTGKILNEDDGLRISLANSSVIEGSGSNNTFTFQVLRTGSTVNPASVDWALDFTGLTASAADFTGDTSGSIQFATGETSKSVAITTNGDSEKENNETFKIKLTNGTIPVNTSEATATINDDDYSISLADASVTEGNTGVTATTFTATRTGNLAQAVTLNWQVQAGTALAADFENGVLPSGVLTFNANSATATFAVNVATDTVIETNETYSVVLSGLVAGGSFTRDTATGTINNDDSGFVIAAGADALEGTTSNGTAQFTITRQGPTTQAATVNWSLDTSSTATAEDYTGPTSGTATFAIGATTATINITTVADRNIETDETLVVKLSTPSQNHTILTDTASLKILNDDTDVKITLINNALEGDTANGQVGFRITREGYLAETDSIQYAVSNGTTTSQDYVASTLPSGAVAFAANQATADFFVPVLADTVLEEDETFIVTITATKAHVDISGPTAMGTILNDEDQISFSTISVDKAEGNDAQNPTSFTYTVQRSNGSGATSVQWSVAGTGSSSTSADDFVATSGTLQFADGETSKDLVLQVVGDNTAEVNETFTVTLANPAAGSTLVTGANTATGTILGDEAGIRIRSLDKLLNEGNSGAVAFRFEVMRTGDLTQSATIGYNITGSGTHAADAHDFGGVLPSGNIVFAAGESLKTVYVGVRSDGVAENNEEFTVNLTNTTGMHIFSNSDTATITNDDFGVRLVALQTSVKEGHTGNVTQTQFKVELLGTPTGQVTGSYRVVGVGDHPVTADDFQGTVLPSGTFTLDTNTTSSTITMNILGDANVGSDEKFKVILENVQGAAVIETDTTTTVQDDDSYVGLKSTLISVLEGSGDVGTPLVVELERTGALSESAQVHWRVVTAEGSGVDASDFVFEGLPQGVVTFAANQTTAQATLQVYSDNLAELNENFRFELYEPGAGVTILPDKQVAEGTLQNDDQQLRIQGVDTVHKEGTDFSEPFTFDITRIGKVDQALSVNWQVVAVNGQSSADATDFTTPMSGSFTWQANETNHRLILNNVLDNVAEPDEHFRVEVSAQGLATVTADGKLVNDDTAPQSSVRLAQATSVQADWAQDVQLATSDDLESYANAPSHIFLSASRIDFDSNADLVNPSEEDQDLSSLAG